MGIPVFREPVSAADNKSKTIPDTCTRARSAIRRSRSVRYPRVRDTPSSAPRYPPVTVSDAAGRNQSHRRRYHSSEYAEFASQAVRNEPPGLSSFGFNHGSAEVEADADNARREASDRRRMENGRALLRDALSYERPGQMMISRSATTTTTTTTASNRNASDVPLSTVPPYPEAAHRAFSHSWDRFMDENRRIEAAAQRNYAPTPPPYTAIDGPLPDPPTQVPEASSSTATSTSLVPASQSRPVGSASYTRRFAPAYRFTDPITDPATRLRSNPNRIHRHHHNHHHHHHQNHQPVGSTTNPPSSSSTARTTQINNIPVDISELPPLRRMGHRSIATYLASSRRSPRPPHPRALPPPPSSTAPTAGTQPRLTNQPPFVDGLGDRQRSRSPTPSSDAWDTLLTTITPDVHLPSASTSFASATASASASARESSATTSLTTPSADADHQHTGEAEYPLICDDDDDDDELDDEEDEDDEGEGDEHILAGLSSGSTTPLDGNGEDGDETASSASSAYGNLSASDRALRNYLLRQIPSPMPEDMPEGGAVYAGAYRLAGFPAPGLPPASLSLGGGEVGDEQRRTRAREEETREMPGVNGELGGIRRMLEELVGRDDIADEWFEEVGLVRRRRGGEEGDVPGRDGEMF